MPEILKPPEETTVSQTFDVSLGLPAPVNDKPSTPAPIEPTPKPTKPAKEVPQKKPTFNPPPIALPPNPLPPTTKAEPMPVPPVQKNTLDNLKPPPPLVQPDNAPITDMESYKRAQQAKRLAAQGYSQRDINEMLAQSKPPLSEDAKRDAIIQNNLKQGSNGIFLITSKTRYTAQIVFNGWKHDPSLSKREAYEINVGFGENIDLAIVKKVIAVIRRDYDGDFNWESQRLGRVVTLSARPEDNAGLEEFLMREFFGQVGIPAQ